MAKASERYGLDRLIDRPMLRSALDEALERRLTLIVAQAGAGKTTLLRQWSAAHADREFVFLDIDATDDDPVHFTARFLAVLTAVDPAVARVAEAVGLNDVGPDDAGLGVPWVAAMASVLEAMSEVVIVVDDVQRLSNARLVADLVELVDELPHRVHLVLSSRFDPPVALSRYRLEDELLEVRQADLAFTELESAELLRRIIGYPLRSSQVRALRDRTEGWAAGLQFAGLELKHAQDPNAFIAEFGGSDRLVADYLGEEVLASLPTERRNLLLHMSTLDEMCSDLVEAATGSDRGQAVLEELEHESMFLVPLDTRREWFRFHHLFRDLLRTRLRDEDPTEEVNILIAAADWNFASGRVKSAVKYLLEASMLRVPEPIRSEHISEGVLAGLEYADQARAIEHAWTDLVPGPEPLPVVQRHLLRAWLATCNEAPDEATRQLTEAVKVAEIHGLIEVFLRAGPKILEQLAAVSGLQAEFSRIILTRADQSTVQRPQSDLPDPLTDRELEILKYFPTRFTNIELAERCFVSVNTIKTHMAHIYRKLDATNRDTAINRARQFGLL